ncbi:DUF2306 domain-containing protein [Pareuzebyella sediminis]|uniref:DUF2306 domain-containing protein n=1 Tax=Pareuzebyella sediminis TaxID=2607998 RepID=UPI0011EC4317|nr:DUF2306 domain-containing protein [Pareuzebyella sediminis]
MNTTNRVAWFVFVALAIIIGLYPLVYVFNGEFGLLVSKSDTLKADLFYNIGFYGHILFGGLALCIGWSQFSKRLRTANLKRHRIIGRIYVIAVLISACCGIFIALNANGGLISTLGFISLGLIWLFTTLKAYRAIRKGDLSLHQGMMIYSYAACFAAVTLRIWLPLLLVVIEDFTTAYRVVAWLCWVPNMIFAFFWIRRKGLIID